MNPLRDTRLKIEDAVYKSRINVALDRAERSKTYKTFKNDLLEGLMYQITTVATERNVDNLSLFIKAKKINEPLITQISTLLAERSIANYIDLKIFLVWGGNQGGQAALDKLGLKGVFSIKDPELLAYFEDHSNLIIDSVDRYTKEWIAGKLQQGVETGLSPKEIAQTLIDEGKAITKVRAERIALTELASAMSKVESEASRRYGIDEHIWRTSRDELVCPICLPLDGKKGPIDGEIEDYIIPAHPSCRCFYEDIIPQGWSLHDNIWLGQ